MNLTIFGIKHSPMDNMETNSQIFQVYHFSYEEDVGSSNDEEENHGYLLPQSTPILYRISTSNGGEKPIEETTHIPSMALSFGNFIFDNDILTSNDDEEKGLDDIRNKKNIVSETVPF